MMITMMCRIVRVAVVCAVVGANDASAFAGEADGAVPSPSADVAPHSQVQPPAALAGFLDTVARQSPQFHRYDYRAHNASPGRGAGGFSVDIVLAGNKLDARGFYPPADATAFLLAVDKAAADAGARWRALYNDAQVGDAIARRAKRGSVTFVGQPRLGKIDLLNYHGPAPLKLHIHLDVALDVSDKR